MALSWEKVSAGLQPATAGHAKQSLFFCTRLYVRSIFGGQNLGTYNQDALWCPCRGGSSNMYPLTVRHHNVLSIRFTTVRKKIFVPRQILEYGRTWIERRKEGREQGGRHLHRNGIVTVSLSLHRGSKKPALLSGSSQVLTSNELQGKTACLSFYIIKNPMIY